MREEPIPRIPVFGWDALSGGRRSSLPCLLELPRLYYSTSGSASILLALEALGMGAGDGVLMPSYHCPTMVSPTTQLGALPLFYPIDEHGTPDLAWLSAQDLRQVKAMLAVHYFGAPQPMGVIKQWCADRGIALIEDCAHALFGRSGGRPVGSWGDVAVGSLTKFLPLSEGGCLVLNRPHCPPALQHQSLLADAKAVLNILELGASHGRLHGLNRLILASLAAFRRLRGHSATGPDNIATVGAGVTVPTGVDLSTFSSRARSRLTRPCHWLARALPRARIVERRRRNFVYLHGRLDGLGGLRPLLPRLPSDCAPYVFPLWVDNPDPGYAELRRLGMPVYRWDRLWPGATGLPSDHGMLWSHHVLQLACHQDLGPEHLDRLAGILVRLYAKTSTSLASSTAMGTDDGRSLGP